MPGLYGLGAIVDTALAATGHRRARWVSKPLLMPLLAVERPPDGLAPAVALAGSWAGDIALLHDGERAFLAGLGSFLGAHVAYVTAFTTRGGRPGPVRLAAIAATTTTAAAVFGRLAGPLRWPVRAYALAVGSTVAAASTLRGPGAGHTVAGAVTFAVSDSLIALGRFTTVGRRHLGWNRASVMATYALAQWLIHDGLSRARCPEPPSPPTAGCARG